MNDVTHFFEIFHTTLPLVIYLTKQAYGVMSTFGRFPLLPKWGDAIFGGPLREYTNKKNFICIFIAYLKKQYSKMSHSLSLVLKKLKSHFYISSEKNNISHKNY